MVAIMLPAGHFAGEFYTTSEAESPEYYEVRLGREIIRLDPVTYSVWAFAHGDPQAMAAGGEPNRLSVNAMSREAGFGDITQQINDLQSLGLLHHVLPVGAQLQRFAENNRIRALTLGLGNTADDLRSIQIGLPEQFRLRVPSLAYNVWLYSDYYGSLWETCTELAPQAVTESGEMTPTEVLNDFFAVLPAMIAVSCAYIDRR